eukprot:g65740.t1
MIECDFVAQEKGPPAFNLLRVTGVVGVLLTSAFGWAAFAQAPDKDSVDVNATKKHLQEREASKKELKEAEARHKKAKKEPNEAETKLEKAKNELKEAETKLKEAKNELKEAETKLKEAKNELKDAKNELEKADAKLEKAEADLKEAKATGTEEDVRLARRKVDFALGGVASAQKIVDARTNQISSLLKQPAAGLDMHLVTKRFRRTEATPDQLPSLYVPRKVLVQETVRAITAEPTHAQQPRHLSTHFHGFRGSGKTCFLQLVAEKLLEEKKHVYFLSSPLARVASRRVSCA